MDVLLQDGDMVIDHSGAAVRIDGVREQLQQAVLRIAVRRGSLPHDPAFGSRLYRMGGTGARGTCNERALAAVREALAPMPGVRAVSAVCRISPGEGRLTVRVGLEIQNRPYALEVTV